MNVIRSENNIMVDVDGTLIDHVAPDSLSTLPTEEVLSVSDPLQAGKLIKVRINKAMVRLLEEEHNRGSTIIVWSRGGYRWASNVIQALGLDNKVDYVMTKPLVYFDDVEVQDWLKYRVFLTPETVYKTN